MLRRNDGFFLAEALLALSAWLMIAGIIYPLIMQTVSQTFLQRQEDEAVQVLYETLQKSIKEGNIPVHETIETERNRYEIVAVMSNGEGAPTEVCVKYEDLFKQTNRICENFK